MSVPDVAIPKGSWILITGINGFLASHVAKQLLDRGYKVRGTARDLSKAAFLIDDVFKTQTASGNFELAHIPDLAEQEPVNLALRNVSGIVHIAADLTFNPDPHKAIPLTVSWTTNLLRAARERTGENKSFRFVMCSTAVAAAETHIPGTRIHLTRDGWNDAAVDRAWAPPPYDGKRGMDNYVAAKIEAERTMWKVAAEWPGLVANTIFPGMFYGPVLSKEQPASTAGWLWGIYNGGPPPVDFVAIAGWLDVRDNALLHIAALIDPEVRNARIQAFGDVINWNKVLGVIRKLYPGRKTVEDLAESPDLNLITTDDKELSRSLIQKWSGRAGYISLEDSVKDTINSFET